MKFIYSICVMLALIISLYVLGQYYISLSDSYIENIYIHELYI